MKYQAYPDYKDSGALGLDNIPLSWHAQRVKFLFYLGRGRVISQEELVDEEEYPVYSSQTKDNGCLGYINTFDFDCKQITWTTDGANAGTVFIRSGRHKCTNVCGTLQPKSESNNMECLLYCLQYVTQFYKRPDTNGAKIMNGEMGEIFVTLPTRNEQDIISSFLYHETAKIDTLIEKQQQLIKLLKEKRQAVISHDVTKGLNPNAPMRDSGVDWLGDVPEHWGVKRFKFLCDRIIAGPFGSSITKDMYVKDGYKVYGQEQVIPNDFSIGDYYISEKDYMYLSRYRVFPRDILISCGGTFGKIAVFPVDTESGIINPRLVKASINKKGNPYYIREMLKSEMVYKQFELLSSGGTMGVINIAILSEIITVVPPIQEQIEVVAYINEQKAKFGNLIDGANNAVSFLKERRTALISAAVTDKIDVRHWNGESA